MTVDLRTLLLVVAAADVAVAVVLALGAGRRLRFGIAPWIGSLFVRALAVTVLVARLEPQAAVLVVSAALLSLSISFQASALLASSLDYHETLQRLARLAVADDPIAEVCVRPPITATFEPEPSLRQDLLERWARYRSLYAALKPEFRKGKSGEPVPTSQ